MFCDGSADSPHWQEAASAHGDFSFCQIFLSLQPDPDPFTSLQSSSLRFLSPHLHEKTIEIYLSSTASHLHKQSWRLKVVKDWFRVFTGQVLVCPHGFYGLLQPPSLALFSLPYFCLSILIKPSIWYRDSEACGMVTQLPQSHKVASPQ